MLTYANQPLRLRPEDIDWERFDALNRPGLPGLTSYLGSSQLGTPGMLRYQHGTVGYVGWTRRTVVTTDRREIARRGWTDERRARQIQTQKASAAERKALDGQTEDERRAWKRARKAANMARYRARAAEKRAADQQRRRAA